MLLAAGVATAAVGLGLLLGLGSAGGSVLVGPLRTFAFTAALTVAVTHLLPEALGALGAPALLVFAAASVAPAWAGIVRHFAGAKSGGGHGGAVLGAGYAGLLVHHVGDGLGLGAYSELPGGALAHADVLAALAVHTVPLVAVVTLAFRAQSGVRAAVSRALGLAVASVGGVLLSGSVPAAFTESLAAWIAAGVAGLLLHVVTHDLGRDLPATPAARIADWFAAVLGVLTSTLGADADLAELRHAMLEALRTGATRAAPVLVLGLAGALLLARMRPNRVHPPALPESAKGIDGALLGAALSSMRLGFLFWVGTALSAALSAWFTRHRPEHPPHDHRHLAHHHEHSATLRDHDEHPATLRDHHVHPHSAGMLRDDDDHPHLAHHHDEHFATLRHHDEHPATVRDHDEHPATPRHHDEHSATLRDHHEHSATTPHGRDAHGAAPHAHTVALDAEHVVDGARAGTADKTLVREYVAWSVTGLALYALLSASLGPDALGRLGLPLAIAGAAFCGIALELPPVTAVFVAAALLERALRPEAALTFAVLAATRIPLRLVPLVVTLAVALGAGFLAGGVRLTASSLPFAASAVALVLLGAALVFAAWQHGIRGLFATVFHSHDSV